MKTRTIKELLQLMLDNQNLFCKGLCGWSTELGYYGLINSSECSQLIKYIDDNKPSKLHHYFFGNGNYYWNPGEIKPRIKWIKKHIKLNS